VLKPVHEKSQPFTRFVYFYSEGVRQVERFARKQGYAVVLKVSLYDLS
jgi:DNA-binding LacI/PurR family transcriptional regulator